MESYRDRKIRIIGLIYLNIPKSRNSSIKKRFFENQRFATVKKSIYTATYINIGRIK